MALAELWLAVSCGHLDDLAHHDDLYCGVPHYEVHYVLHRYLNHYDFLNGSWKGVPHCGYAVPHVAQNEGAHHGDHYVRYVAHCVVCYVEQYVVPSDVEHGGDYDWDVGYDVEGHQQ